MTPRTSSGARRRPDVPTVVRPEVHPHRARPADPGCLALRAYWTQQGAQIAFSAKERVGHGVSRTGEQLVVALVEARGLAVQAGTGDAEAKSALPDALARVGETSKAVDAAEAETGAQLETTKLWRELKATIATATAPQPTAQQAFDAYQPAVDGALGLVVQVANGRT